MRSTASVVGPGLFARASAVRAGGPGSYEADLAPDWWVGDAPNGGYLAAVALRAIDDELARRDGATARPQSARALTVHFLRPARPGAIDIDVGLQRGGRTVTSVSAHLTQAGRLIATSLAVATTAKVGPTERSDLCSSGPPEDHGPSPWTGALGGCYETRLVGRPVESAGGVVRAQAWIRLAGGEALDAAGVVAITDALPPAVALSRGWRGPTPTVELSVHTRTFLVPSRWCLVTSTSTPAGHGCIEEDTEVHSEDGRLLARARQVVLLATR